MKNVRRTLVLLLLSCLAVAPAARACDLCAIYASLGAKESATGWFTGAFEQLTSFSTLRVDGRKIANPDHQRLTSSITQAIVGYQFTDELGVQANVPYIARTFRRPGADGVEHGSESGLGDAVLLAHWRPVLYYRGDVLATVTFLGGVKLPTGSSRRIREELAEEPESEDSPNPPSGIHGHDVALGSGSTDGLFGTSVFLRYRRFFTTVDAQYALRRTGDFGYRYADDFNWSVSPGYYLDLSHENTLSLGAVLSGEHKGLDRLGDVRAEDTGIDAFYLGARVTYSWSADLYGELGADRPVRQRNTALQAVPDYRVRLAVTWRP